MGNDLTISKANSFVEASYSMSLDEMRVLSLTLGVFDPTNPKVGFDFTVAEFCEHFPDVNKERAYEQVQRAIKKISNRWMTLQNDERILREVAFVTDRTYFKKEGRFYIEFHQKLLPYISNLKQRYTTYQLVNIGAFTSTHTIRLYELCTQYRTVGTREILVDELRSWLQVTDKYELYANFRKWVLEPSIDEINSKSDLIVSMEQVKRGRRIHAVKFTITPKQAVENAEFSANLTKSGRPKLPQRPHVKSGSRAEGDHARECIAILKNWEKQGNELSENELRMLAGYLEIIGDDAKAKAIWKRLGKAKPSEPEAIKIPDNPRARFHFLWNSRMQNKDSWGLDGKGDSREKLEELLALSDTAGVSISDKEQVRKALERYLQNNPQEQEFYLGEDIEWRSIDPLDEFVENAVAELEEPEDSEVQKYFGELEELEQIAAEDWTKEQERNVEFVEEESEIKRLLEQFERMQKEQAELLEQLSALKNKTA